MEFGDAVRGRRMVRSFSRRAVPVDVLDRLLGLTLRAPTAGNTAGTAWVVLEGEEQTARYWGAATTQRWRSTSRRWAGLSRAPVVAVSLTAPSAYVARYQETDKAAGASDLGLTRSQDSWPVPYWWGDAAFSVMTLLLGAASERLGACFLGNFRSEAVVLSALGVPAEWRIFGAVVLGYPDGEDHRSPSLDRRTGAPERLHYGRWGGER